MEGLFFGSKRFGGKFVLGAESRNTTIVHRGRPVNNLPLRRPRIKAERYVFQPPGLGRFVVGPQVRSGTIPCERFFRKL